ncbi:MAG: ABC transporter permease subunit [Bacillota bacterium]
MQRVVKGLIMKAISWLLIFTLFFYLTALICSIPRNLRITNVDGKLVSTYSLRDIVNFTSMNLKEIYSGNLSDTFKGKNQKEILIVKLQKTSILLGCGILLGIIFGILKGIFDSRRTKGKDSYLKVLLTIIPISMPDMLNIALLQMFALWLIRNGIKVFKVAGQGTVAHMILPVIALSILPTVYIARVTALSIESCYNTDYVKAAIGKGCSKTRILWNHVMRNALGIISEGMSNMTAMIICNLLIVEFMFSYMGLAVSLVQFFQNRDSIGMITIILMIGAVYFILDNIFQLLKKITYRAAREGSI